MTDVSPSSVATSHIPSSRTKPATVLASLQSLHTHNGSLTDLQANRRNSLTLPSAASHPPVPPPPPPHLDTSSTAQSLPIPTPKPSTPPSYFSLYLERVGLLNSLLVFFFPALLLRILHSHLTLQFFLACLAIVPLAGFLGEATEHLSDHFGPGTGGLLNATFGNAAELIIASFSVFRGLDTLVKSSLVGSIIGNLLLVLGASILCGGMRFASQSFSINAANIDSNMCVVAAIGFLVPSMFHHFNAADGEVASEHKLSLGISSIFLLTYLFMLFFQLHTHSYFFAKVEDAAKAALGVGQPSTQTATETSALLSRPSPSSARPPMRRHPTSSFHIPRSFRKTARSRGNSDGNTTPRSAGTPTTPSYERLGRSLDRQGSLKRDEYGATLVDVYEESMSGREEKEPPLQPALILAGVSDIHSESEEVWSMQKSLVVLVISTAGIVMLSEILTGAVEEAGAALGLSHLFVGVIIVAIVGNAAEHSTAVLAAMHNDMDIAISIAFGSALQIAMFVMPVIVLLSYVREGPPMDLTLSEFEVFGVTCATVISWMVVQDGASTWLEGLMLLVIYLILALAFYFTHD